MSRIKLPKRLAGVKIPKSVRKGAVADFLNSSAGQLLLVETLNVAAVAAERSDGLPEVRLASAMQEALVAFRQALGVTADMVLPMDREMDDPATADHPPAAVGAD